MRNRKPKTPPLPNPQPLWPGERFDGTPFTDRGFDHVPALSHLVPRLADVRAAA